MSKNKHTQDEIDYAILNFLEIKEDGSIPEFYLQQQNEHDEHLYRYWVSNFFNIDFFYLQSLTHPDSTQDFHCSFSSKHKSTYASTDNEHLIKCTSDLFDIIVDGVTFDLIILHPNGDMIMGDTVSFDIHKHLRLLEKGARLGMGIVTKHFSFCFHTSTATVETEFE